MMDPSRILGHLRSVINYGIHCGTNKGGTSEGLGPWNHLSSRNIYYYLPQREMLTQMQAHHSWLESIHGTWGTNLTWFYHQRAVIGGSAHNLH